MLAFFLHTLMAFPMRVSGNARPSRKYGMDLSQAAESHAADNKLCTAGHMGKKQRDRASRGKGKGGGVCKGDQARHLDTLQSWLEAPCSSHVVVLDHHHVEQAHAVQRRAADQDCPFVQQPEAWHCLASAEHLSTCTLHTIRQTLSCSPATQVGRQETDWR